MFERRLRILAILGGIYLLAIAGRLFHMQVLDSDRWRLEAAELAQRTIRLTAKRGAILDRNGLPLAEDRIRVSGKVAAESLHVADDGRQAAFSLQGRRHRLPVVCPGPLPDRLAEGIDVVVEGRLDASGCLRGEKIVTRCASKYESRATSQRTARAGEDGRR